MTQADVTTKLRLIAKLTAAELPGYETAARERGFLDGEVAALLARRTELKIRKG